MESGLQELKFSRYNQKVELSGKLFLYNALTGGYASVDEEYRDNFDKCDFKKLDSMKELAELPNAIINQLMEGGFIIPKNFDEFNVIKSMHYRGRFGANKALTMTLIPTMNCNFRCPYCYEKDKKYPVKKMTTEVMDAIIKYVESRIDSVDHIFVTWYGGEPLLGLHEIRIMQNKLIELASQKDSARMSHIYFVEPAIQGAIASKLLTLSIIEVIKYIVSRYILKDVDRELPGYWWLLTFMPVCCIGIIYFIYYLVEKRPENGVVFGAMLSSCLFLPLNLGIFKIYDLLSREFLLKQQNVIYEQNIRLFSEEMRMKEESLISRNIIHDYRKHFLVIQGMAYGEQCEEIVQYLDKLNIYYEKEKSLVNCGNFVIDAMMNSKYLIACKENIKHEDRIVVPEAMNFEDVDLCILLGNMLDNAYEATKKAEKKIINTSIIYSKGKLTIGVKNTYDGIIEKDRKGNYISTKMNKTNHGMGIKLMQRIVDKYNGFLSLENDDNYFVVIAVLIEKIM